MKHRFGLSFFLISILLFASSCGRNHESFYFGSYSEAEQLYNHGEYEKAIQKYQAYRDENQEGNLAVISLYYIGKSRAALGQNDEAKKIFEQIIKDHPDAVWANFSETQMKQLGTGNPVEPAAEEFETRQLPKKRKKFFFF